MEERRGHVRVKIPVLVEFPQPDTYKTERSFTQDISDTGLRFPTTSKLSIGQELALTLRLPYADTAMQATGEVVWIREVARHGDTQYEVGLRFRWIEDPDQQRLARFFTSLSGPRAR